MGPGLGAKMPASRRAHTDKCSSVHPHRGPPPPPASPGDPSRPSSRSGPGSYQMLLLPCVLEHVGHSVLSDSLRPMDCSLPGSSIHGILQARILEGVAISFSRGSSRPRDRTLVSHTVGRLYRLSHQRGADRKPYPAFIVP